MDAGGEVVGPFFGASAIDNIPDSWDREGCFSDVGSDDDETMTGWRWLEDFELLVVRQERVEREDVHRR